MIREIYIDEKILDYIEKRWLLKQYEKAEKYLYNWNLKQVNLKIREPKNDRIYYFRLNKQFRIWCTINNWILHIFHIDNHQN